MWLPFRQPMPEAPEHPAVGGRCSSDERPSQDVVVGTSGGLKGAIAFISEDREPFAPVRGVDLAANQAVTLEAGHEMSRTSRTEQHPISEV